ncbi:hypothetical protein [Myroides odoratus]|uniref:hypothetical protein n=1 Tax=Myroides odoratus TaxID=256 RepID=UPI0039AE96CD
MNRITTSQLRAIENLLITQYDLHFDGFRNESVDHIACEIEESMNRGMAYEEALKSSIGNWHFELKPILGEKGIPTLVVKRLYKKDGITYFFLILLFFVSWFGDRYSLIESVLNPWFSLVIILLGFLLSVGIQKRFFKQKCYEMMFYMQGLKHLMLVNIITLTLAMLNLKAEFGTFFFLSPYHIFILTLNVLVWNILFTSKIIQKYKLSKTQVI